MAAVSAEFIARWRSRQHVGAKRPRAKLEYRNGHFARGYGAHTMLDGSRPRVGYFPTASQRRPWHAWWVSTSDWTPIPGLMEIGCEQDFDNNGITRGSITCENVVYSERNGLEGLYHLIERGFLAPWRGFDSGRGGVQQRNVWYDQLAQNAQIRVWETYGAAEDQWVCTFTGLLDDLDLESSPDRIVLTCRDFGQMMVDQRFMGYVKDKMIKDPVTFADRRLADSTTAAGASAKASSNRIGSHARFVLDKDPKTQWVSRGHDVAQNTEWIQIRLPRGRYEDFFIEPGDNGMRCYISVYARAGRRGPAKVDNVAVDEGWLDLGGSDVPGDNGGHPFIRQIANLGKRGRRYRIGHILELGDDSVMRLSFRNLQRGRKGLRYASVNRFVAVRRRRTKEAIKARWILVDDVSDIVKIILRWCGFQEWEVENVGTSLADKMVFNRSDFLIDAIKKLEELTGYVFFMGDPSGHPNSRGVPTFRQSSAFRDPGRNIQTIRGRDLLTALKVRITDEPLVTVIRVRGKLAKASQGGRRDFVGSGADTLSAYQAFYRPPWARGTPDNATPETPHSERLAGLIKHVVHIDPQLSSRAECHKAARLIAAAQALKAVTAVAEIPANPGFELDDQVYVVDVGTGMATRLWIASRSHTFKRGQQTSWTMSVGGALLDSPDLTQIRNELEAIYAAGPDVDEGLLTGHGEGVRG